MTVETPDTITNVNPKLQESIITVNVLPDLNNPQDFTISRSITVAPEHEVITIAGGCFWGIESLYRKFFAINGKGLIDARVGYANGTTLNPTYKDVKTDTTGHTEVLQLVYDPELVTFETLIDFFFRIHDPTTLNRQDHDVGIQYRSAIFYHTEEQKRRAEIIKQKVQLKYYPEDEIVTAFEPIENFWDAEEYHQLYIFKNPTKTECPSHFLRTKPKRSIPVAL